MNSIDNIVVYNSGEIELKISIDNDTIWLNQVQLSELFETSVDNVSLHLKNIYKEGELDENRTVEYFSIVRKEGSRNVKRMIKHYNLDAIISLGYRINSKKATRFRQWAMIILNFYFLMLSWIIYNSKLLIQHCFPWFAFSKMSGESLSVSGRLD